MTSIIKFPASTSTRRRFVLGAAGLGALPVITACAGPAKAAPDFKVGALLAGRINDRGFMEAGWSGLERARTELRVQTRHIDNIPPKKEQLMAALTELAGSEVDLVVAHGGQNNEACAEVAAKFPGVRFAVTQGAVQSANLCSYDVLQEESAYLGGVLAALTSRTGVIGHMSGIRVRPGLKGRAAYVAGAKAARPDIRVLTNFSGNQDDNALSQRIASAQIAAGADVIFTMLNAGRDGVTQACRASGARQIGNVIDWVAVDPKVFVASAIADVSIGMYEAIKDAQAGHFPAGQVQHIGIANERAVRLSMAPDVPAPVRERVAATARGIAAGQIKVPVDYNGPEFAMPA
ncbi:MAG: BMP family protein [Hydrogenophaga sp.]|uniref:BMP family protein n=1 Tax=Hydrogenophaga sp. TaxID=1904254 RepID=UPI0025BD70B5|nr:BMP family protein [Hydrogenophaga sp.]MBT9550837.1 BMP family protein [Hydrogenophaga sp.]